jgi:hypothetical protein
VNLRPADLGRPLSRRNYLKALRHPAYSCFTQDYTSNNGQVKLVKTSGTAFTLSTMRPAAKNDAIGYFCVGN